MVSKKKKKLAAEPPRPPEEPAAPPEKAPLERRVLAILAVAFLAGAVLMTLEIVGGRIVAARFGSHVFVWGGLIGIFMGALSLGYFFGGRLADRFPNVVAMGVMLLLAGGTLLVLPLVSGPVCILVGDLFFPNNIEMANRWNPTVAIIILFTAPSLLLGSVSPFTVRLLARDIRTLGRVAARVYALNALGSIAGTLLTAFFLMGVMGNAMILVSAGVLLLLLGGGAIASQWLGPFKSPVPSGKPRPA
jgi:MFS family permease